MYPMHEQEAESDMDKWIQGRVLSYLRSNCEKLKAGLEEEHLTGRMLKKMTVSALSSFFEVRSQTKGLALYNKIHQIDVSPPAIFLLLFADRMCTDRTVVEIRMAMTIKDAMSGNFLSKECQSC